MRVEARIDGRRVSGVARFHRIEGGRASPTSCASTGATGESIEISAGTYEVRLMRGGVTLTDVVTVSGGSVRRVNLTN